MRWRVLVGLLTLFALTSGLGVPTSATGQDDKKKVVKNFYELRALPYGDDYILLRFERFSGRAWKYSMLKWQEIDEMGRVPTGLYDIHLIPLPNPVTPRDWRAIRIEQETGTTWNLIKNKWEEMLEK